MPEPLIIEVRGNNAPWRQAVQQSKQLGRSMADEMIAQTKRFNAEIIKQAKLAGDAQVRESKRSTKEVIKDFHDAVAASKRGTTETTKAHRQAQDAIIRGSKRQRDQLMKDIKEVAENDDRETKKAEQRAARAAITKSRENAKGYDAQLKASKQVMTQEEVENAAKLRLIRRTNRERIDAAEKQIQSTGRLIKWEGQLTRVTTSTAKANAQSFGFAQSAAEGFTGAVANLAAGMLSFSTVEGVIRNISQMWSDMRRDAHESALEINGVRESLLELAALKGQLGDTTGIMKGQLDFRAKTLQEGPQAKALTQQMLNVGQANIGAGLISQGEFDKAMVGAGQFQAAEGGDAATHGKLAGIIPALVGKKGITADEVGATRNKFFNLMQLGGFDFSSGANQLIDKQSLVTGGDFKDPARMVATLSALSVGSSPLEAGTHLQQLTAGTTGSFQRARLGKLEGEHKTTHAYLQGIGAKEGMDPLEMGTLIARDLNSARDKAAAAGKPFDPTMYLQRSGYMNQEAGAAVKTLAGLERTGQLGNFTARAGTASGLLPADEQAPGFVSADKQLDMFRSSSVAATRRVSIGKQIATTAAGGGAMEYYTPWAEQAFNSLKAEDPKRFYGDFDSRKDDWGVQNSKTSIYRRMMDSIVTAAKKKGIAVPNEGRNGLQVGEYDFGAFGKMPGTPNAMESDRDRADQVVGLAGKMGLSGAEISEALMERLTRSSDEQLRVMKSIDQKLGASPIPPPVGGGRPAPVIR